MVVKIVMPSRKGHEQVEMILEDAQREIQIGVDNGYIPIYNGKQVAVSEVQDGQEIRLFPAVQGG